MASTCSTKRTGRAICPARRARIPSASVGYGAASALDHTTAPGAANVTPARNSPNFAPDGATRAL